MDKLLEEHKYNLLASDMISLHRTLPDARSIECKSLSYPARLPTTSVIIIFHNEGWSTLLRTVWSVIDRSPPELIKEIVLVDDFSTWLFLKRPLDDYIELLPVNIILIRTSKREGLIRARLIGAQHATVSERIFILWLHICARKLENCWSWIEYWNPDPFNRFNVYRSLPFYTDGTESRPNLIMNLKSSRQRVS